MMPVPSYQLIPFLAWLHLHGIKVSVERMEFGQLRELARRFLRTGGHLPLDGLDGLMSVFQACPVIQEPTVEEQMAHFAGCGQCLEMISGRGPGAGSPGDARPFQGPFGDQAAHSVELHPLLAGFVEWAQGSRLEDRMRRAGHQGRRKESHEDPVHAFRNFIHEVGGDLREGFGRYVADMREREPDLVADYERWRRSEERYPPAPQRGPRLRVDENTHPIGPNESFDQAAQRLADSVRQALEHGFYDDSIAEEPQLVRLMSMTMESPENLGQALEFMGWLRRREPELVLPGSIPSAELEELALRFCEEQDYSNGRSFAKEARKWLSGAGPERILSRIARFLGLDRRPRMPDGRPNPHNPLDRYGAVRFHGIFLFLSSGDFPSFIATHWRDLHHLTGDFLDIYFSQMDLQDRTSGYEIANQFRSAEVRVDALPAMLLWEDQLDASVSIRLQGLEHEEVVEVVKTVVQAIRDGCPLKMVQEHGRAKWRELRERHGESLLVHNNGVLLINHGGVVGDIYENKGVVGAMGANAVAHDNVFVQDARAVLSEVQLTAADGAVIAQLAEVLASRQIEGIALGDRLQGAKHLAALAGAATNCQSAEQPTAGWRKWLTSMGDRSQSVIAFLANVTTIASPIAKLLGLPL